MILRKCCNLTTSFLSKIILLTFKIVRHQSCCHDVVMSRGSTSSTTNQYLKQAKLKIVQLKQTSIRNNSFSINLLLVGINRIDRWYNIDCIYNIFYLLQFSIIWSCVLCTKYCFLWHFMWSLFIYQNWIRKLPLSHIPVPMYSSILSITLVIL